MKSFHRKLSSLVAILCLGMFLGACAGPEREPRVDLDGMTDKANDEYEQKR